MISDLAQLNAAEYQIGKQCFVNPLISNTDKDWKSKNKQNEGAKTRNFPFCQGKLY